MELWRIANYADLSGIGGLKAAGRWHSQVRRILYLADHPSSAMLEMLVHMDRDLIRPTYQLLRIDLPPAITMEIVQLQDRRIGGPIRWQAGKLAINGSIEPRAPCCRCRLPLAIRGITFS
jgi:RES domain-containing protein